MYACMNEYMSTVYGWVSSSEAVKTDDNLNFIKLAYLTRQVYDTCDEVHSI